MRARRSVPTRSSALSFAFVGSALALCTAFLAAQEDAAPVPPAAQKYRHAAIIHFDGQITPWLQGYVERKVAAAQEAGADLIILQIDSPGGYLHESSNIAHKLNNLKDVHTVAYIPREALSGAALVSLGCDEIILHPSARIGDVGVIFLDEDFMFRHAPEKVRSPLVIEMRDLAVEHDRPPALTEAMVDLDLEVFRYVNQRTNAEQFMSEKEVTSRADAMDWQKHELVLESKKGSFLTVTGTRAKELRLAEATVANLEELKARYEVAGKWQEYRVDSVDKTVYVLNLWWVTGLLFIVGLVGILYECCAPGTCIGGLVGLLCFSLFYWSRFLGGTSGWLEVVLFLVGIVFLGIELFVLPGFGVAGVMGLVMIGISIILACQTFVLPETMHDLQTTTGALATLLGSGLIFIGIAYAMTTYLGKIPLLSQLILAPAQPADGSYEPEDDDKAVGVAVKKIPIGAIGKSTTILRPSGRAMIDGQPVDVVSTGEVIGVGVKIRVVEVGYGRVVVEEAEPAA
jgi:membrane-bound serine protease (ClpP class)